MQSYSVINEPLIKSFLNNINIMDNLIPFSEQAPHVINFPKQLIISLVVYSNKKSEEET